MFLVKVIVPHTLVVWTKAPINYGYTKSLGEEQALAIITIKA